MDFAIVLLILSLILSLIPIVLLVWGVAFVLFDDTFCDGLFQCKIRQWVIEKMEDER